MKTKTIEEIEMSKRIGKVYNYSVDLCEKISENDQFARVVTSRYLTNIQNSNQVEYDETFERMLKDYSISKMVHQQKNINVLIILLGIFMMN